ncbi:MAG: transposase [Candidatus Omnitrophota bacterium]
MPRLARKFYDEAVYHVMQRGNNKNKIFFEAQDYSKFLRLIAKYKDKYSFELYNYCLMPNHVHLLIRINKKEHMAKLFQGLFQSFQYHHRRKYDYCGSLYQKRYKSILIENDSYLLECARYIERNSLRDKIVNSMAKYKWSSYNYYARGEKNKIITLNPLYLSLAKTTTKRRRLYMAYVVQPRPYEELLDKNIEKLR